MSSSVADSSRRNWRYQIPALAEHFRVAVPDQRGYNLTEKPRTGYNIRTLTTDIAELMRGIHEALQTTAAAATTASVKLAPLVEKTIQWAQQLFVRKSSQPTCNMVHWNAPNSRHPIR